MTPHDVQRPDVSPRNSQSCRTAAALVIGNELLTGKAADCNLPVLAKVLFELGIELRRAVFCPDEVETIRYELEALRSSHDVVITSGGVGPTHDDVTTSAVALAFGEDLVRSTELAGLLTNFYGERLTPHHLRMAEIPQRAELLTQPGTPWPTVRVGNVFVLPGLPEIFEKKMTVLRRVLAGDEPFVSRSLGTLWDEGRLAPLLERLSQDYPEVAIGSYPRWGDDPMRVLVTLDGRRPELVDEAFAALLRGLPADQIIDPCHAPRPTAEALGETARSR